MLEGVLSFFFFGIMLRGECAISAVSPLGHWVPLLVHNRASHAAPPPIKKQTKKWNWLPTSSFWKTAIFSFLCLQISFAFLSEPSPRFMSGRIGRWGPVSVHWESISTSCETGLSPPPLPLPSKSGFAWNEWVLQAQLHQRSLCNDINGPLNLVSSVLFISTIFANNCMLFRRSIFYNPAFPPQQPPLFSLHFHPALSVSVTPCFPRWHFFHR